jgi:hypothetical protein
VGAAQAHGLGVVVSHALAHQLPVSTSVADFFLLYAVWLRTPIGRKDMVPRPAALARSYALRCPLVPHADRTHGHGHDGQPHAPHERLTAPPLRMHACVSRVHAHSHATHCLTPQERRRKDKCRLGTDSTFGAWVAALADETANLAESPALVGVDLLNFNMNWPWPLPNRCHGPSTHSTRRRPRTCDPSRPAMRVVAMAALWVRTNGRVCV